MISDLLKAGIVKQSDSPTFTMNLSVRPKPNNPNKSLLISDCRALIANSVYAPKSFTLPKLSTLFHLPKNVLYYFTKLDLSNAYHSVSLPNWLEDQFRFSAILTQGGIPVILKWAPLWLG